MNDWFRSWHGAPTNPKWRTIAKRAGVPTSLVVALAWTLLDRASLADDRGSVAGSDPETLADFLDCDREDVERILRAMAEKDFLTGDRLSGWERRQPKREREPDDGAAERQRMKRARDRSATAVDDGATDGVTTRHAMSRHVTPREEERRLDTDPPSLRSVGEGAPERATAGRTNGSRISPGWVPDLIDREYAAQQGLTEADFDREAERFRDYWLAKAGANARKVDWRAAWRTWARKASEERPRGQALLLPIAGGARASPGAVPMSGRPMSGARSAMAGIDAVLNARQEAS